MAIQIPKLPLELSKLSEFLAKHVPSSLFPARKTVETKGKRRIGLNIGHANIVACEMLSQEGKLILESCICKQVSKEKPISEQLKALFQEAKFQSKEVNVSLKGPGVVVRFLSFPRMNRLDFASSIQFEAEKYLPFSLSEVVLDYHILSAAEGATGEDANTMGVILVAARKTEVNKLVDIAKDAGIGLNAIDVDIFAYVNAFEYTIPDAKTRSIALLDFGAGDTTLGILDKGELTFSRDIAFGGNDLTEMIRRKLNVPIEEASRVQHDPKLNHPDRVAAVKEGLGRLFQEIRSSINYYYSQHQNATPVEAAYISGGLSQLSALPEILAQQIEIPVKNWDPVSNLKVSETVNSEILKELLPYLPVSVGLAIRDK